MRAMTVAHLPDLLSHLPRPRVLELGSRHVSPGRWERPAHWEVVGVDVHAGPGVDVVADAHDLGAHFEPESFDAVYSHATFEHLLMPWKVLDGLARLLRPDGVAWIVTHEAFPLHELPWDFWRFGSWTWEALAAGSGLQLLGARGLHPVRVEPVGDATPFEGHASCEAQFRKTGPAPAARRWDVALDEVLPARHLYPTADDAGGLSRLRRRLARLPDHAARLFTDKRPAPADPFGASQWPGPGRVLAGPAARPLELRDAEVHELDTDALGRTDTRAALADLPDGALKLLVLLDVLHREPAPWVLALDCARVLAPGGVLLVETTQVAPGAFGGWRVSAEGLRGLFHPASGFARLHTAWHEPARVVGEGMDTGRARCWEVVRGVAVRSGGIDRERLAWDP